MLSDDRVLPPYQGKKGKRTHPGDDDDTGGAPGKRHQQGNDAQNPPRQSPIPGVSFISHQPSTSAYVYHPNAGPAPLAPQQLALTNVNFPPLGDVQIQQVPVPGVVYQTIQVPGHFGVPPGGALQVQHQSVQQVASQVVPAVLSQPPPALPSGGASFTLVKTKRVRRKPNQAPKVDGATPTRLTPSRVAKSKGGKSAKSATPSQPMDVVSPAENYESCTSLEEDGANGQEGQEVEVKD